MEYQININYQFTAESEQEANDKAQSYISSNMAIKQDHTQYYQSAGLTIQLTNSE